MLENKGPHAQLMRKPVCTAFGELLGSCSDLNADALAHSSPRPVCKYPPYKLPHKRKGRYKLVSVAQHCFQFQGARHTGAHPNENYK